MWAARQRVGMDEFLVFRDLGRGAFGAVSGSTLSYTGQMFALKCMNRKQVKGKKAFKLTMTEKNVLHMLGNKPTPFCIHLRYSFFDAENLYFALPLCSGGDLLFHLRQSGSMSPARAQFVATEVAMGLNHMHELGIVYRDLKPVSLNEIWITSDGVSTKTLTHSLTHSPLVLTPCLFSIGKRAPDGLWACLHLRHGSRDKIRQGKDNPQGKGWDARILVPRNA